MTCVVADHQNSNAVFVFAEKKIVGEPVQVGPFVAPDAFAEVFRVLGDLHDLVPEFQVEIISQPGIRHLFVISHDGIHFREDPGMEGHIHRGHRFRIL